MNPTPDSKETLAGAPYSQAERDQIRKIAGQLSVRDEGHTLDAVSEAKQLIYLAMAEGYYRQQGDQILATVRVRQAARQEGYIQGRADERAGAPNRYDPNTDPKKEGVSR